MLEKQYLVQITAAARRRGAVETGILESNEAIEDSGFGQPLPLDLELADEQKTQLEKLREEVTRSGKNVP